MNAVRNTSRQAFHAIKDLGNRQTAVLEVIRKYGPLCNLDIAYRIQQPINRITPRTNELLKAGMIEESHRAISSLTGRRVIFWKEKQP